jgi:glycosyltransferase involved in cell wall biosynthesis
MVVPPWYEVPPSGYGGIEMICASLVDALCARGHEVTILGAGSGTSTAARFIAATPEPQFARLGEILPELRHAAVVNRILAEGDFDVVHDHTLGGPLAAATRPMPTVMTVHNPPGGDLGDFCGALGDNITLVAISDAQRRVRPELNWAATVHNALDTSNFAAVPATDGPVLWLARFTADKGPDLAIEACRAAGLPLVLAGKCTEPDERRYLDETILPLLGPDVELIRDADRATVRRLLEEARCLIMPIRWEEPFGMVMIEAMAMGRPVVGLSRGSVPEVVAHGVSGWVCDDPAELPDALLRVGELDPVRVADMARDRFNAELMARRYERVYLDALARHKLRTRTERTVPTPRFPTRILRSDRLVAGGLDQPPRTSASPA